VPIQVPPSQGAHAARDAERHDLIQLRRHPGTD